MLLHKMAHPRFIAGMIMMTLTATSPATAFGQERNITQTSIVSHVVFNKSFKEQVALGRGDTNILNSSWSLINHEMLADEFPQDWRAIPDQAKQTASIQKIVVGGVNPEMGLESFDPDWAKAPPFEIPMKPAGKVLEGLIDNFEVPPATPESEGTDPDSVPNNIPTNLVDNLEYYLANYFKPATNQQTRRTRWGQQLFKIIKCTRCHTPGLVIERDQRVADLETGDLMGGQVHDHFARATPLVQDGPKSVNPIVRTLFNDPLKAKGFVADFNRHDQDPNSLNRNVDEILTKEFMTDSLSGGGSTAPAGNGGWNSDLRKVILGHDGKARASRDAFARLPNREQALIIEYLQTLVLFGPPDMPSNPTPGSYGTPNLPREGQGRIDLSGFRNDQTDL